MPGRVRVVPNFQLSDVVRRRARDSGSWANSILQPPVARTSSPHGGCSRTQAARAGWQGFGRAGMRAGSWKRGGASSKRPTRSVEVLGSRFSVLGSSYGPDAAGPYPFEAQSLGVGHSLLDIRCSLPRITAPTQRGPTLLRPGPWALVIPCWIFEIPSPASRPRRSGALPF